MTAYTLSQVAIASGAKRRSIQIWADAGALRCELPTNKAGTGTHRAFPREEVQIAAVLASVAKLRISIGVLCRIAATIRKDITGIVHAIESGQAGCGLYHLYDDPPMSLSIDLSRVPLIEET